ncbi:MAG TPA: hypothetical protein DCE41_24325 [Cytophagales bacterium]|nr:hypothetical protein [Cytophagales bacterium]HAA17778.1 hypothetical protein [Cytophagales bacterium]HAP59846.1 hypothetical protein [Cytophagales bacterium]
MALRGLLFLRSKKKQGAWQNNFPFFKTCCWDTLGKNFEGIGAPDLITHRWRAMLWVAGGGFHLGRLIGLGW